MRFNEIKTLNEQSKHPKIANVTFWHSNWNSSYDQFQVNYKSGKTCFYYRFANMPKTVQDFIKNSNRQEVIYETKETATVYFLL